MAIPVVDLNNEVSMIRLPTPAILVRQAVGRSAVAPAPHSIGFLFTFTVADEVISMLEDSKGRRVSDTVILWVVAVPHDMRIQGIKEGRSLAGKRVQVMNDLVIDARFKADYCIMRT